MGRGLCCRQPGDGHGDSGYARLCQLQGAVLAVVAQEAREGHGGDGGDGGDGGQSGVTHTGWGRDTTYVVEVFPLLRPLPVREPVVDHLLLPRPVHGCKARADWGQLPCRTPLLSGAPSPVPPRAWGQQGSPAGRWRSRGSGWR